ncbi:MAG: hypothetical protein ACK4QW_04535 [Alphaproteobacteria bacterium]
MRSALVYAAIASLFLTGFKFAFGPVDLYLHYLYMPAIILAGIVVNRTVVGLPLAALLAGLAVHALFAVALFGSPPARAVLQLAVLAGTFVMFHQILALAGGDVFRIMRAYMRLAAAAALIGLVQVAAFLAGIRAGYDFSRFIPDFALHVNELGIIRAQSIFKEPSHLGQILAPAIFVAVLNLVSARPVFVGRRLSAVIVAVALLSFSTVGYTAIFASVSLVALNLRRGAAAWALVVGVVLAVGLYSHVPEFKIRVDDTIGALLYNDLFRANFSTLTLYNNLHVTLAHLAETRFWGGGLGSHLSAFERHSVLYGFSGLPFQIAYLNAEDANSLLLRILSELGLPGLVGFAAFLWFGYLGRRTASGPGRTGDGGASGDGSPYWIVSNAALVLFLVALLRQGHYANFGVPLFMLVYVRAAIAGRRAEAAAASGVPPSRPAGSTA